MDMSLVDFGSSVAEGIPSGGTLSCSVMNGGSIKCWRWIQSYDNGDHHEIQYPLLDVYGGVALSVAVGALGGQVKDSDTCFSGCKYVDNQHSCFITVDGLIKC